MSRPHALDPGARAWLEREAARPTSAAIGRGHIWSKSDIATLVILKADGKTYKQIGRALGRSPIAIKEQIMKLNRKAQLWLIKDAIANYAHALSVLQHKNDLP